METQKKTYPETYTEIYIGTYTDTCTEAETETYAETYTETNMETHKEPDTETNMGWLRLVESIKLQVSFAKQSLFYRALLQQRPIILSILLTKATPCRD